MKLSAESYRELGKAFLNLGQGVALAGIVSSFFTEKALEVNWLLLLSGIFVGVVLVATGLIFIERSERIKRGENLK